MNQSGIFRSLQHRNFRIFFLGQVVSLHGTWMQSVAQSWLVYRLTESGFMLGLTGTATLLPTLLFGLYGGWLADRFCRKRLLILVQSLASIQALLLGVLTIMGWITPWLVVSLAFALGLVQALETPARQAFVAGLVPRDVLHNAIGLNSSMFHLARFAGPATAGFLVAWVGEGPVFLLNAVSFFTVIISLTFITGQTAGNKPRGDFRSGILAGVHFAKNHAIVGFALMLVALTSMFGGATVILLPIYAGDIFQRGPESLGWLMAMLGIGSLYAAISLAKRTDVQHIEGRIAVASVGMALGLTMFSWNSHYFLGLALLPIVGYCATSVYTSSNALIQCAVPDELRGRIMALYTICLHGMVAVGQLILGAMSDWLTAPVTVLLSATIMLVLAAITGSALRRAKKTAHA